MRFWSLCVFALLLSVSTVTWADPIGHAPPLPTKTLRLGQPGPHPETRVKRTAKARKKRSSKARRITLDLKDADVVNVIRLIGDVSQKNFVVGDGVQGKVTVKLRNVPWDEALEVILVTKGLGIDKHGSIWRIAPQSELDAEEASELSKQKSCEDSSALKTRIIPVHYGVAKDMAEVVKGTLSKRGTISVDERTNTLIVRDVDCP